jgi:hypothetical protein
LSAGVAGSSAGRHNPTRISGVKVRVPLGLLHGLARHR